MGKWLYLMAGGIAGTLARYVMAGAVAQRCGAIFPWGTIAVNLTGCLVIGFLDVVFEKKFLLNPHFRILLMTGFCGAFTTFSSLILETSHLLKENEFFYAVGNVLISVALGLAAFKLGAMIAEIL